jgi:hypothetical protein
MQRPTTTADTNEAHQPLAAAVAAVSPSQQAAAAADSRCCPLSDDILALTPEYGALAGATLWHNGARRISEPL